MATILRRGLTGLLVASASLVMLSCGSGASNNDQGTSFLSLGYFADGDGEAGQSGAIVPLFTDASQLTEFGTADGNTVLTFIGLENRIQTQFIRVTRIDCIYDIPGSQLQIPPDSFNFASILSPAPFDLPPGFPAPPAQSVDPAAGGDTPGRGSTLFAQFEIVSPDIFAFLNNNASLLPQLPFRMNVICSAVGVTQAGDTLTTNPATYFIQFVDFAECCTGAEADGVPDFQQGPGTGGTLVTTEGDVDSDQGDGNNSIPGGGSSSGTIEGLP